MVRPVCIKNTDFRFGRITVFFFKIILQKLNVCQIHGKPHLCTVSIKLCIRIRNKASNRRNVTRYSRFHNKCFRDFRIGQTGINRVDYIFFNFFNIRCWNLSAYDKHFCTAYNRRIRSNFGCTGQAFAQNKQTLLCRICPLVILPRKIFPDNYCFIVFYRNFWKIIKITLRFRKNPCCGSLCNCFRNIFYIVAV